jgi:hypothetical protein
MTQGTEDLRRFEVASHQHGSFTEGSDDPIAGDGVQGRESLADHVEVGGDLLGLAVRPAQ